MLEKVSAACGERQVFGPLALATVWELFAKVAATLTEEDLAQLPKDGARQLDHYIYGFPSVKKDTPKE